MGIESWVAKGSSYCVFLATDSQGELALVAAITNKSADQQRQLWKNIVAVFRNTPGRVIETTYTNIAANCGAASRIVVLGDFVSEALFERSVITTNSLEDMVQNPSLKANVWHAITSTFFSKK